MALVVVVVSPLTCRLGSGTRRQGISRRLSQAKVECERPGHKRREMSVTRGLLARCWNEKMMKTI